MQLQFNISVIYALLFIPILVSVVCCSLSNEKRQIKNSVKKKSKRVLYMNSSSLKGKTNVFPHKKKKLNLAKNVIN